MPRYNSYGMSPVTRRPPIGMNVGAFADAVTRLDAKYQDMAKQQSAIDIAIGQLPVNAAEDAWKMEVADEIRNQINVVDNPNDRYLTAIKAAGQLMSRPDVIGRIRAEAEYQNFVKQTQARNDIDQRTKNWAIETNPYTYSDTRDANGRIVGGTQWKPTNTPVANVNLASLGTLALQWAKPDEYKGSKATFVDAEGNFTEDISNAVDVAYQTAEGWTRLGQDKLKQAIQAAIDMTPGARASIHQDYQIAQWDYNKLSEEEKKALYGSEITDNNGRLLTESEFLQKKLNPFYTAASYDKSESSMSFGTGLKTAYEIKQKEQAAELSAAAQAQGFNFSGLGTPVTYDTSQYIATAQASVDDAISRIEGAMPSLKRSQTWNSAKAVGDYNKMERVAREIKLSNGKRYIDGVSPEAQRIVNNALADINNNKAWLNKVYEGVDDDTRNKLMVYNAIDAGQPLPGDNPYSKEIYNYINRLSNGKAADSYQFRFNSEEDKRVMLDRLGLDEGSAISNGFEFGNEKGNPTLTIKANNGMAIKTILAFNKDKDDFSLIPPMFRKLSEIRALDSSGNVLGTTTRGTLITNLIGSTVLSGFSIFKDAMGEGARLGDLNTISHFYDKLEYDVSKFNATSGLGRTTGQLSLYDVPEKVEIQNKLMNGEIKASEAKDLDSRVDEGFVRAMNGDLTQYQVLGVDEDTNTLRILQNEKKNELMANIRGHINDGKYAYQFGIDQLGNVGYYVTLTGKQDKEGNYSENETYFITSGIESEGLQRFKNSPSTRAVIEYNRNKGVNGNYRTKLGINITNITNNGCKINGVDSTEQEGINYIYIDKLMEDVANDVNNGVTNSISATILLNIIGSNSNLKALVEQKLDELIKM